MQTDILAATEKRVDAKIAQLQGLQDKMTTLLGQRDDAQKAQLAALVKTYTTMPAKKAAPISKPCRTMCWCRWRGQMKSDVLALVLASMEASDKAQALTVKLANKLTLPQTPPMPWPRSQSHHCDQPPPTGACRPGTDRGYGSQLRRPAQAAPEKSATPKG